MHSIIHIGAGQAAELEEWRASGAERIVLVEPNPHLAEQLRQRTCGEANIIVVEAAITTTPTNNQLHEYNLPDASSLRPGTALKQLFPGLKIVNTYHVATLTPAQLMEQYGPEPSEPATLVMQAPGEEHVIIQALAEAEAISGFSQLRITTNRDPLYEGSQAAENLLNTLQTLGYNIQQENQQDPDWPIWQLARDPQQDKIAVLEENLEALEQQLKESNANLLDVTRQKGDLKNQLAQARQETTIAENAKAEEKERHKTREQKLIAELEELRQTAQEFAVASDELAEARDALTKEQATHKQTTNTLQESRKAIEEREQKLSKANQQLQEEKKSHQQTEKCLEDHKQWLQSRKQQAEQQQIELAKLKKEIDQLQQQVKHEAEALTQARKELATNTEKLAEQKTKNNKLDDLEKKIASLGSNLISHFDEKLINTAKQIEDTLGLQNYLNTGELPLSYHGWPISPDLALYLTERLETQSYDLVIEFGSGTSTVLFAKILMKKMLRHQMPGGQKRITGNQNSEEAHTRVESADLPNDSDLPKRVLTFEHNEHYHEQTGTMLRQAGLEQVVNLVYAPLVDYSYQGDDYLYYDCDKALAKFAEIYEGRVPKILVLVDGPPGATGPNARFPALPKLLNHLSMAKFEVILDDYNRTEEKSVADKWVELIKERSKTYSETKIPLEKGALCITIG